MPSGEVLLVNGRDGSRLGELAMPIVLPHPGFSIRTGVSSALAVWALSRPRRRIPVVTCPAAYVPDPNEPDVLSDEQLQKFPESLRSIIEMYQELRCDDWPD